MQPYYICDEANKADEEKFSAVIQHCRNAEGLPVIQKYHIHFYDFEILSVLSIHLNIKLVISSWL